MQNEILLGMLTNPNFNFHDEYVSSYIPWIESKYPYILVLLKPKMSSVYPDKSVIDEFSDLVVYFISVPDFSNNYCLLFWFDNLSYAEENIKIIRTKAEHLLDNEYYFSISEPLTGVEDMQSSYLVLREELINQRRNSFDPPVELQKDIIDKLKSNKSDACIKLLNRAKFLYDPDTFVALLIDVAFENEIDLTEITTAYYWHRDNNRYSEQWDIIITIACNLCQLISTPHHTSKELAESIRQYVENNYRDPDISVKQLADRYSMHRTLISKLLKSHLGVSFSDYLLDLRMNKSLELLQSSDISITAIAEAVGYVNYSTFKRAFIRSQGISPRDYRECNKILDSTEASTASE